MSEEKTNSKQNNNSLLILGFVILFFVILCSVLIIGYLFVLLNNKDSEIKKLNVSLNEKINEINNLNNQINNINLTHCSKELEELINESSNVFNAYIVLNKRGFAYACVETESGTKICSDC